MAAPWIIGKKTDLVHDQRRRVGRNAAQGAQRIFAVSDREDEYNLAICYYLYKLKILYE